MLLIYHVWIESSRNGRNGALLSSSTSDVSVNALPPLFVRYRVLVIFFVSHSITLNESVLYFNGVNTFDNF
jgi:hypothetical protein